MNKQELAQVRKLRKLKYELINRLCIDYKEDFVATNSKKRERILNIIHKMELCLYMLEQGLENRKMLNSCRELIKKYSK